MNARSLFKKMDDQRLQVAMSNIVKDSSFLLITESWLNTFLLDSAIGLAVYMAKQHDRAADPGSSALCGHQ